MVGLLKTSNAQRFFLSILVFLVVTDLAILLDIPILRQVLGFLFLTFLPGLLILLILKLDRLGFLEKLLLSVGLSVAFSMLFGFLVNGSLHALGYAKPVSTIPLLSSFSIANAILLIVAYGRNKGFTPSLSNLRLTTTEKAFLVLPVLFPLLSILGMRTMNSTDNNVWLMFLLFLIPAYVIFVSLFNRRVPEKVYPIAIFLISISLLLMFSLRSNHLIGADVHIEYYLFQTTLSNSHWSILGSGILDACLSISLLPSIYQIFLHVDSEFLFKVLYSLIVSILPLVVYILCRKYIGAFYAFLGSIFFMSQIVFLWTPAEARGNIAVLFFALAIMVFFQDNISEFARRALFVILTISVIVSHYSGAYIFFFILLLTLIGTRILSSIISRRKELAPASAGNVAGEDPPISLPPRGHHLGSDAKVPKATTPESSRTQLRMGITTTLVVLFFVMLFFWNSQLTEAPFYSVVRSLQQTFANLGRFFVAEARETGVQAAFGGVALTKGIPQWVHFVVSWLTVFFVAIGVLTAIRRYKAMVPTPGSGHGKLDFLSRKLEPEYFVLLMACFALLVVSVVFPVISKSYSVSRVYFQAMVPLAIFFVIGGITASRYIKSHPQWVILLVLIPYFLCATGAMYQIFGQPGAITLSSEGRHYDQEYVSDQESYGAKWLGDKAGENTKIYTFRYGSNRLISQGGIQSWRIDNHSLIERDSEINGYIYLRYHNVVNGKVLDEQGSHDISEYQDKFAGKGMIYSNGGSEIWISN